MALKASGAVQARGGATTIDGDGYIYSFNGPHSLFSDTIRSLRALALSHQLGHVLMAENDERDFAVGRLVAARPDDRQVQRLLRRGTRRLRRPRPGGPREHLQHQRRPLPLPSTQQGYSPFSTWTRGLAWIMAGYPEQLEFLASVNDDELEPLRRTEEIRRADDAGRRGRPAISIIESTPTDGVPYWDTGAPGLVHLGDYQNRPADPFNDFEPVDSSAAAIAAKGCLRLGRYLRQRGEQERGSRYWQAGLTVLRTLLDEPYLSVEPDHQGLLLHTIYHRPRGWDHVPEGSKIAMRRVVHVGRLPSPRSGAVRPADDHRRTLLRLLPARERLTQSGQVRRSWT